MIGPRVGALFLLVTHLSAPSWAFFDFFKNSEDDGHVAKPGVPYGSAPEGGFVPAPSGEDYKTPVTKGYGLSGILGGLSGYGGHFLRPNMPFNGSSHGSYEGIRGGYGEAESYGSQLGGRPGGSAGSGVEGEGGNPGGRGYGGVAENYLCPTSTSVVYKETTVTHFTTNFTTVSQLLTATVLDLTTVFREIATTGTVLTTAWKPGKTLVRTDTRVLTTTDVVTHVLWTTDTQVLTKTKLVERTSRVTSTVTHTFFSTGTTSRMVQDLQTVTTTQTKHSTVASVEQVYRTSSFFHDVWIQRFAAVPFTVWVPVTKSVWIPVTVIRTYTKWTTKTVKNDYCNNYY